MPRSTHRERHFVQRVGWLRAAVLGANDGIVSTAALVVGIAAADSARATVVLAGLAGLVGGAMSMAAGEYVSVSSQADTERADLARERQELTETPESEVEELQGIYIERGLDPDLALRVATQLTEHDALGAHARDELGITDALAARPTQAALTSAATFAVGAALPLAVASLAPLAAVIPAVSVTSLVALGALGALGAGAGGAGRARGAVRVVFWSTVAMGLTWVVGRMFGG